ncbi:hypothetical protein FA15DRAFT_600495 [Coprinopsis marcescibilis]|uniref:Uncharacterized protein n=1 Tax=Coprinopsis marcescibilis TaxID=230819 RepID=A0A5C3KIC7_COPMA|nr:hypothetical protein FA15DRAFT_600495 [Coprinopsis marcescibilis]
MSRGERATVIQNLSNSMRHNYEEHGVEEYYRKVAATYRNPHYPGIRTSLFTWLNKWWSAAGASKDGSKVVLFDMACGKLPTVAFAEWFKTGRSLHLQTKQNDFVPAPTLVPRRKVQYLSIDDTFPEPLVMASDPFTSQAFMDRTGYSCAKLSFEDISEGTWPGKATNISTDIQRDLPTEEEINSEESEGFHGPLVQMVVCSFAMHLIQEPSELFSLLFQLSSRALWLVILAPHKKPEIKEGWGWTRWDIHNWCETTITDHRGDLLNDRVHCRVYRSNQF